MKNKIDKKIEKLQKYYNFSISLYNNLITMASVFVLPALFTYGKVFILKMATLIPIFFAAVSKIVAKTIKIKISSLKLESQHMEIKKDNEIEKGEEQEKFSHIDIDFATICELDSSATHKHDEYEDDLYK